MFEKGITPVHIFGTSNRFIEAYHTVLQPMCKATGLPPLAVDILMFAANNPEHATARNVCKYRGLKPGIVSVHVERLVSEGLLERREVPGDRRQAADAAGMYGKGRSDCGGRPSAAKDICRKAGCGPE